LRDNLRRLAFFLVWLFVLTSVIRVEAAPTIEELSLSRYWLRLMHYKPRLFGGYKSEIDSSKYFFSPLGKTDPHAEILAAVKAFETSQIITFGTDQYPAQCWYPLRMRFLEKQLGRTFLHPSCPKYENWRHTIKGDSVSLVFTTYFNGAPASMYGHTFLRINRRETKDLPLFNHAVNFAAQTNG